MVTLPLKGLARAKSRILLPASHRASLALAMALDTAAAALLCPIMSGVWVGGGGGGGGDDGVALAFAALSCRVLRDPGGAGQRALVAAWE